MRLKVDQDGERVVMDSWDLRILSAAIASFVVLVIMILCDLSHPVASLECVRHETTKFANVNITKSSSSVGPFTSLDSSATATAGPHQAGEDNDCELLVRRQLGGAASEERGYESGTDLRMGHQQPHEDSSLRAAFLRLMGVRELVFSFEIDSVAAIRLQSFSSSRRMLSAQNQRSDLEERLQFKRRLSRASRLRNLRRPRRDPVGRKSRSPSDSTGSDSTPDLPRSFKDSFSPRTFTAQEQITPSNDANASKAPIDTWHQHHDHHWHPEAPEPDLALVLRDHLGHSYIFFVFKPYEHRAAKRILRTAREYLRLAEYGGGARSSGSTSSNDSNGDLSDIFSWLWTGHASYSESSHAIHLSVRYDNSRWEELIGGACFLLLLLLVWCPVEERAKFNSVTNVFELRHRNFLKWPRLHIAVALDAISHVEVAEEKVVYIQARPQTHRTVSGNVLRERSEYGIRLFIRTAALPATALQKKSATFPQSNASTIDASSSSTRLTELWLGFGRRSTDAALLRRCVECASAVLLNQDGAVHTYGDNLFFVPSPVIDASQTYLDDNAAGSGSWNSSNSDDCSNSICTSDAISNINKSFSTSNALTARAVRTNSMQSSHNLSETSSDNFNKFCSDVGGINHFKNRNNQRQLASMRPSGFVTNGDGRCVVCLEARARVVFFPCRHMKVCRICSRECESCPVCRAPIEERHDLFC